MTSLSSTQASANSQIGQALLNLLSSQVGSASSDLGLLEGSSSSSGSQDSSLLSFLSSSGSQSASDQASSAGVQNASAYTQTASSYLSQIESVLQSMGQLATEASSPSSSASQAASASQGFASLQTQLRSIVGGNASEIGGSGEDSPTGTYNGSALFDSSAEAQSVPTGVAADPSVDVPSTNLLSGAVLQLIQQDSSGDFTLSASDSGAGSAVQSAISQVGGLSDSLSTAQDRLQVAAATLDTGSENLASILASYSDASSATSSAQASMQSDPFTALLSQSGSMSSAVQNLIGSSGDS